jgi:hypothetical protein
MAMIDPAFVAARPDEVMLEDAPINPDWIVSGDPVARAGLHSESLDGRTSTHIWECSAGSFWWTFHDEETVFILEGAVRVTSETGDIRLLRAGDIAFFAGGSRALWDIEKHVRKIAFARHPHSQQVAALREMLGRMKCSANPFYLASPVLGALGAMLPL